MQQACASPSCTDFTQNGDETGVDCGGGCPGCAAGLACKVGADCASGVCTGNICQVPSCTDTIKNGGESDTDCGGSCPLCANGKGCLADTDCAGATCTAGKCTTGMHAELEEEDVSATIAQPHPFVRIVNQGKTSVPLVDLTLRYYFTKEPTGDEAFACYFFNLGTCDTLVSETFTDFTPKTATANRVLEFAFLAGAPTLAASQTAEVRGAFAVPDYSPFTQTNDYSFNNSTSFVVSDHVTVYRKGVLIWGTEP